jgi:hypothetical protein
MGCRGRCPADVVRRVVGETRHRPKSRRARLGQQHPRRSQSFGSRSAELGSQPLDADRPGDGLQPGSFRSEGRWIQGRHARKEDAELGAREVTLLQDPPQGVQGRRLSHGPRSLGHMRDQEREPGWPASSGEPDGGRPDPVLGVSKGPLDHSQGKTNPPLEECLCRHPPCLRIGIGQEGPADRFRVGRMDARRHQTGKDISALPRRGTEERRGGDPIGLPMPCPRSGRTPGPRLGPGPFFARAEDVQRSIEKRPTGLGASGFAGDASGTLFLAHGRTFVVGRRRRSVPWINPA